MARGGTPAGGGGGEVGTTQLTHIMLLETLMAAGGPGVTTRSKAVGAVGAAAAAVAVEAEAIGMACSMHHTMRKVLRRAPPSRVRSGSTHAWRKRGGSDVRWRS